MAGIAQLSRSTRGEPFRARHASPHLRYMAFLSYSHKDAAIAAWLHEELEEFRVPPRLVGKLTDQGPVPKRLAPIFRDRHELAASPDLGEEIEEAIAGSRFLIVLCSPAAAKSRWIDEEIATFKRLHSEERILAAIVDGDPFAIDTPGREDDECFPPSLRVRFDRRGRPTGQRAEPIAADFREEGDGRKMGLLKIAAGMIGVGLDELAQREAQRRHRRLYAITAASIAGMMFASGLAYTAIDARDAARDERREAEGLVAFMVGDLKNKLEPVGRLDALDGVGSRVLAYYSKQDASDLSDAALMQRSQALSLTAQVANLRGDKKTAAQLYRQAMEGTEEAILRDPDDPQRLFDHAQNVFWVGDIARDQGKTDQAEAAYREYKRLADRMVALQPDNLRWRMEVLYAEENIGIALRSQRRFEEAARQFAKALGPMASLAAVDARNLDYQIEYSNLLAWASDSQRDLGRLDTATKLRERQIGLLRKLVAAGQQHVQIPRHLIPAHQGLGILLASQGQPERGIEQFRLAGAEADRLIPIEPDNILWKGLAAQARLELARTLLGLGQLGEADIETRAGCNQSADVQARDRAGSWRHLKTDCLMARSRLALRSAAPAEALKLARQAVASARSERRPDPVSVRYRIAAAQRQQGDVLRQMGDQQGSRRAWAAALALLPRSGAERPAEMHERAELLARLGRQEEAKQVTERLAAIGYRRSI